MDSSKKVWHFCECGYSTEDESNFILHKSTPCTRLSIEAAEEYYAYYATLVTKLREEEGRASILPPLTQHSRDLVYNAFRSMQLKVRQLENIIEGQKQGRRNVTVNLWASREERKYAISSVIRELHKRELVKGVTIDVRYHDAFLKDSE